MNELFHNVSPEYGSRLNALIKAVVDKTNAALYLSSTLQAIDSDLFCKAVDALEASAIEDVKSLGIAARG